MSNCVICYKRLTRSSCNDAVSDKCIDCWNVPKGDENDHNISKECIDCDDSTNIVRNVSLNSTLENSIIFIASQAIDVDESIPMTIEQLIYNDNISLLASLYSQVEFLRSQIQFLNAQLEEKNIIIKSLLNTQSETNIQMTSHDDSTGSNSDNSDSESNDTTTQTDSVNVHNESEYIDNISSQEISEKEKAAKLNLQLDNIRGELHQDYMLNRNFYLQSISAEVYEPAYDSLAPWEKHSMGFGSKMLKKFGYEGKGLGKDGDGIIEPVSIEKKHSFNFIDRGLKSLIDKQNNTNTQRNRVDNVTKPWPNGTTLITGSSILLGVEESRLKKYKAKVRPFPGATIDDMFDYLLPLLKKMPTNIILHIGSNDSPYKSSNEIAEEITTLKGFILCILPSVRVFISCPVIRMDDKKANKTLREFDLHLKYNYNDIVVNDNVDTSCLGKKGLHLNPKGSGRLAINYISLMRRL